MRKVMTILLILLTNIVILVHTVVPHCHHDGVFAAVEIVLDSHDGQSHHHDPGPEDCAISDVVAGAFVRLQEDSSQNHGPVLLEFNPDLFGIDLANLFGVDLADICNLDPLAEPLSELPIPYLASAALEYCADALGLRAPPIC